MRALPADEGRPPFVIVVDVGRVIELYAEFTRSGATYVPYPDPRSHRIALADLAKPDVSARLAAVTSSRPLPVLKDFHNIECRDAMLAYDRVEYEVDQHGRPVTRWDGRTMKHTR